MSVLATSLAPISRCPFVVAGANPLAGMSRRPVSDNVPQISCRDLCWALMDPDLLTTSSFDIYSGRYISGLCLFRGKLDQALLRIKDFLAPKTNLSHLHPGESLDQEMVINEMLAVSTSNTSALRDKWKAGLPHRLHARVYQLSGQLGTKSSVSFFGNSTAIASYIDELVQITDKSLRQGAWIQRYLTDQSYNDAYCSL